MGNSANDWLRLRLGPRCADWANILRVLPGWGSCRRRQPTMQRYWGRTVLNTRGSEYCPTPSPPRVLVPYSPLSKTPQMRTHLSPVAREVTPTPRDSTAYPYQQKVSDSRGRDCRRYKSFNPPAGRGAVDTAGISTTQLLRKTKGVATI